jgi:hypothetical protein
MGKQHKMDDQQELEEWHATNAMVDVDLHATRIRRQLQEVKRIGRELNRNKKNSTRNETDRKRIGSDLQLGSGTVTVKKRVGKTRVHEWKQRNENSKRGNQESDRRGIERKISIGDEKTTGGEHNYKTREKHQTWRTRADITC